LQRNHNHTTIVTIEKVIDETPTVRTLVFSDEVMSMYFLDNLQWFGFLELMNYL